MDALKVPYNRLFFEEHLPGGVIALRDETYALVVGSDSDDERARHVSQDRLCDVLEGHFKRWQEANGKVDEALREAVTHRRLVIRTPTVLYVSPFPLLLQCSGCQRVEPAARLAPRSQVLALANRIRGQRPRLPCHHCGKPLKQLPFVQVHRCGHLIPLEPPRAIRHRRLRLIDGGSFRSSSWHDFDSGVKLGRLYPGQCLMCTHQKEEERHDEEDRMPMEGTKLHGGRGEAFYPQLVEFISLTDATTRLLADFRATSPNTAELGRALVCGLLDLQDPRELRDNLRIGTGECLTPTETGNLQGEQRKLAQSIKLLEALPDMETAVSELKKSLRALEERLLRASGRFSAADAHITDAALLSELGASPRAAEAALLRAEFPQVSLDGQIAEASAAQQLLLENRRDRLLADFGVREIRHLNDVTTVIAAVGFTRQQSEPHEGNSGGYLRLNAFQDQVNTTLAGKALVYALPACTEAILVKLDPCRVLEWAVRNLGWVAPEVTDPRQAHALILALAPTLALAPAEIRRAALKNPDRTPYRDADHVVGLLHTLVHSLLRRAQGGSGYDLNSLTEYLLPADLSALILVGSRKTFSLGGLRTLFDFGLQTWFEQAVLGSLSCPYDPICSDQGGCCNGCLHMPLGCETYNHSLSRAYLTGGTVRDVTGQTLWVNRGFWE